MESWERLGGGAPGGSRETCLICADGASPWSARAESHHLGANAACLPNNRLCPTWCCAEERWFGTPRGRPSDPRRGLNPIFFFCSATKTLRYGCWSAHVPAWCRPPPTLKKLKRYSTDVWLIGRSVSKRLRSDLVTKQAAMRGFSRGRWQIESTLKMAPNGISSF